MTLEEIVQWLETNQNKENAEGMERFGIATTKIYGLTMPQLRKMAKVIGPNHALALKLWSFNSRETRILAGMVEEPKKTTPQQMDTWAQEFDNWEICDQTCQNLYIKTRFAIDKAIEWSDDEREYVKRSGFAIMAWLAFKKQHLKEDTLHTFLTLLKEGASDDRKMVKKSVNWALRQIGKRDKEWNDHAIATAKEIALIGTKPARWIARDALKELESKAVRNRLR